MKEQTQASLLPPQNANDAGKKTLVLDLDETLIHSVFKPIEGSDMIIKIPDEVTDHEGNKYSLMNDIYVFKRPGVDMFLKRLARYYELVIFTASIDKYANPVIDALDKSNLCQYRLYREHCTYMYNVFIKDLKKLGRRMEDILILDNSPISYLFQKQNALPIQTWLDDKNDIELYKYLRPLEYLAKVDDVRTVITQIVDQDKNQINFEIFDEIATKNNKAEQDRKKIHSESRKSVNNRFGYSSMVEANSRRENSANRLDFKTTTLLSNHAKNLKYTSTPKQKKDFGQTQKNPRHETLNLEENDLRPRRVEDDSPKKPIFSAQYSAMGPKRTGIDLSSSKIKKHASTKNDPYDTYNELKHYSPKREGMRHNLSEKYMSATQKLEKTHKRGQRKYSNTGKPITPESNPIPKRNFSTTGKMISQKEKLIEETLHQKSKFGEEKSRANAIYRNQSAKPEYKSKAFNANTPIFSLKAKKSDIKKSNKHKFSTKAVKRKEIGLSENYSDVMNGNYSLNEDSLVMSKSKFV